MPSRQPTILSTIEKQKAIRINSPPFYRLNYRGIVVEAYLSGEKTFVKPDLRENRLIADSVVSLL